MLYPLLLLRYACAVGRFACIARSFIVSLLRRYGCISMIPHEFVERNVSVADAETVPCRICGKKDVHKERCKYGRMDFGW